LNSFIIPMTPSLGDGLRLLSLLSYNVVLESIL
jgi:hypothetical protein